MKREDSPMWSDPEESPFVRELLDAGRGAPVEYDAAKGLAAHLAHVKAGTPLPHWAQPGAAATSMSTAALMGWIALPVVAASVIAAMYFGNQPSAQPTSVNGIVATPAVVVAPPSGTAVAPEVAPQVAPSEEPVVAPVGKAPSAAAMSKSSRVVRKSDARNVESAAKLSSENKLQASKLQTPSTPRNGAVVSTTSPIARTAPQDSSATIKPARESEQAVEPQAEKAAEPAAAVRPQVDESRLEREMQMLAVAQRVLSQDPDRALRLAQQGDREFPNSMFSAERKQVGLLAMVKLGQIDEARRIGQPFLAKYPNAPWSARLRRALATGRVE